MSWDPELDELLVDTVELKNPTATDGFQGGEYTYPPTGSTHRVHLNMETKRVRTRAGELVRVEGTVTFGEVVAVDPRAVVVLPARFQFREMKVLGSAEQPTDEDGQHHTIVYLT